MQALMKLAGGEGHVDLQDVPKPVPPQGNVLIRVQVAAVCGTDVHIYYDRFPNTPPLILGHEFSGTVEELGAQVAGIAVGDRVVSENNPFACGVCRLCQLGYPNLCPQKRAMGILSDGCFADYVTLPAHLVHRIPGGVAFEEAALAEPLAVATHAVAGRAGVTQGDVVVVLGPGAIGLLAAQVARAEGAGRVLLAGTARDTLRFDCAKTLGLETLCVDTQDLAASVMALTNGVGADVVVEASGSPGAVAQGLRILRRNGRMAVSGITGRGELPIQWDAMVSKAISLHFAYSSRRQDWDKALGFLAAGTVDTRPLITHRIPIQQWKTAFDLLETLQSIRSVFPIGPEASP